MLYTFCDTLYFHVLSCLSYKTEKEVQETLLVRAAQRDLDKCKNVQDLEENRNTALTAILNTLDVSNSLVYILLSVKWLFCTRMSNKEFRLLLRSRKLLRG